MFSFISSLSWPAQVFLLLTIPSLVYAYFSIQAELKIRRLGGHAAVRRLKYPLGIDYILDLIKDCSKDRELFFWDKNFRKFGNPANPYTYEVGIGGKRAIVTADPENIKAILATQFNDYGKGERFNKYWHEFLGDSIFSTDHQKWHDSRQLIRPQFIKDRVSDLGIFEEHVNILMSQVPQGQPVDMKDLFFKFTLDAATHFLLGRSVNSLTSGKDVFAEAFAEVQRRQCTIARAGPLQWMIPRGEFRRHLAVINRFVEPFIEEALSLSPEELEKRTKSDEGYTFLHAIAAYTRDKKVLRDQLIAVLLAGRDTTACTLSWLFHHLGRNPDIVAKLRKEIQDVVGLERAPAYADLKSMKYLQACLSETLRLYPIVPFNVRLALKDTTLPRGGGPDGSQPIGVLKGTPIPYSTHYMQLLAENYPPTSEDFPDPIKFAPQRWEKWSPKPWTYIPFNGGPRICVGQQFALTEMAYTVVRILQRFSRVEEYVEPEPYGATSKQNNDVPLEANPSLPMRLLREHVRMTSDIVLAPADPVMTVFNQ